MLLMFAMPIVMSHRRIMIDQTSVYIPKTAWQIQTMPPVPIKKPVNNYHRPIWMLLRPTEMSNRPQLSVYMPSQIFQTQPLHKNMSSCLFHRSSTFFNRSTTIFYRHWPVPKTHIRMFKMPVLSLNMHQNIFNTRPKIVDTH